MDSPGTFGNCPIVSFGIPHSLCTTLHQSPINSDYSRLSISRIEVPFKQPARPLLWPGAFGRGCCSSAHANWCRRSNAQMLQERKSGRRWPEMRVAHACMAVDMFFAARLLEAVVVTVEAGDGLSKLVDYSGNRRYGPSDR